MEVERKEIDACMCLCLSAEVMVRVEAMQPRPLWTHA